MMNKYVLLTALSMIASPAFSASQENSSQGAFKPQSEKSADAYGYGPKHPPVQNRFQAPRTKAYIPKRSRGFFNGSSGSMTMQGFRGRSRQVSVL